MDDSKIDRRCITESRTILLYKKRQDDDELWYIMTDNEAIERTCHLLHEG
jgi:hypothetical protein